MPGRLRAPVSSCSSWLLSSPSPARGPLAIGLHSRASSSSRSTSSKLWLQRQKSDPFVRARGDEFVSRSAFKLLELQTKSRGTLLRPGMTVVDLGAAPGGWVQAAAQALDSSHGPHARIIAVDLLPLHPSVLALPALTFIQGDFLDPRVQSRVHAALPDGQGGAVDLVLSDMLANLSGTPGRDAQLSLDLCTSALAFALAHLRATPSPGPSLVVKFLQSEFSADFARTLRAHFGSVRWDKPNSSRAESREGYWVCAGFRGRAALEPTRVHKEEKEDEGSIFF